MFVHKTKVYFSLPSIIVLFWATYNVLTNHVIAGRAESMDSITVKRIDGPTFIERGHNATLTCVYDLGKDKLHSINWSRNDVIFFS